MVKKKEINIIELWSKVIYFYVMENEIKFICQKKLLIFGIDAVGKSALISAIGRSDMKDENKSEDSK